MEYYTAIKVIALDRETVSDNVGGKEQSMKGPL